MTKSMFALSVPVVVLNVLVAICAAKLAQFMSGEVILVWHDSDVMKDAEWRAFALKQFWQTSIWVFGASACCVLINTELHKITSNAAGHTGRSSIRVALALTIPVFSAGILGAALGAYHVYVDTPPYF